MKEESEFLHLILLYFFEQIQSDDNPLDLKRDGWCQKIYTSNDWKYPALAYSKPQG